MQLTCAVDSLHDGMIIALLEQHRQEMFKHSPPESVHALDVESMRAPEITFWGARDQHGALAACGALKYLGNAHAELKSMKTADEFLRRGCARLLLQHIVTEAVQRGYAQLSLETGVTDVFIPAVNLYLSEGFKPSGPFADYTEDPHSQFLSLSL